MQLALVLSLALQGGVSSEDGGGSCTSNTSVNVCDRTVLFPTHVTANTLNNTLHIRSEMWLRVLFVCEGPAYGICICLQKYTLDWGLHRLICPSRLLRFMMVCDSSVSIVTSLRVG